MLGPVRSLLVIALLWPVQAGANHDDVPDPALRTTQTKLATLPRLDRHAITVSGLSSGGFFAHQFHVAYSKLVNGAGIIAGGPYGCVETIPNPYWPWWTLDRLSAALVACTHYYGDRFYGLRPAAPKVQDSVALMRDAAREQAIDDPANLADDRVWIFHGSKDEIVPKPVVDALKGLYAAAGIGEARLHSVQRAANHGMPVITFSGESRFPKRSCDEHALPFIIQCGFEAAGELLRHLYGSGFDPASQDAHDNGRLIAFDQREFGALEAAASLSGVGYVYVPTHCQTQPCRLHVAFHGCRQYADNTQADRVHDDFIRDTGYNGHAAANNLVILYPQVTRSDVNPNGCWDFWGYSGDDYRGKQGKQMRAVMAMVARLLGG